MSELLEILKYVLPSIIVFATVFYMLRQYFAHETEKRNYEFRKQTEAASYPIKLQSYERLSLFLERIRIHNLMMRLQSKDMDSATLLHTLMMGLTQEYEHNIVQQIYISDKLWEIIVFAKNEVMHALTEVSTLHKNNDIETTRKYLYETSDPKTEAILNTALLAIKKEIQLMIR